MRCRSYTYIRKEQVLEFVRKNPGVTTKGVSGYFQSQVSTTLRRLLLEGKLTRIKEGCFKWYVKKEMMKDG